MNKIISVLYIIAIFTFLTQDLWADELSALKDQFKAMQKQMQEQAEQIETMHKRIKKLEAEKSAKVETPKEMDEKAAAEEESKGPLYVKIGQGDLKISGYAQALYRYYELDSENDSFSLPRVRIKFDGDIIPELTYRIQIDAAASSNILRDAYIKYEKYPCANIIIGQTFIPFSEEQLYPTTKLELIDRSLATSRLSYDRDIGIQLQGELFDNRLSYGAGVFNGAGRNTADNNDNKDVVARAVISPFKGKAAFLEGLSLGGAFQYGKQPRSENTEGDRTVIGALAKYEKEERG